MTSGGNQWCSGIPDRLRHARDVRPLRLRRLDQRLPTPQPDPGLPGLRLRRPNPAPYGACAARLLVSTSGWTVEPQRRVRLRRAEAELHGRPADGLVRLVVPDRHARRHARAAITATPATSRCPSGSRPTPSASPSARRLYYANDTYGGNSGSPIFTNGRRAPQVRRVVRDGRARLRHLRAIGGPPECRRSTSRPSPWSRRSRRRRRRRAWRWRRRSSSRNHSFTSSRLAAFRSSIEPIVVPGVGMADGAVRRGDQVLAPGRRAGCRPGASRSGPRRAARPARPE